MEFNFKKIFKREPKVKTSHPFVSLDADRDWKTIFYLSMAITVLLLGWSGYIFWTVQTGRAFDNVSTQTATTTTFSPADLANLRTSVKQKAIRFSETSSSSAVFFDPSR